MRKTPSTKRKLTPSETEERVTTTNPLNTIIELARQNDFGKKMPYNLQMGIREFCREFQATKKPFGLYDLNGDEVIFVNESLLDENQRNLFAKTRAVRTEAPFVYVLKLGKVATMPKPPNDFVLVDNSAVAN